MKKTNKIVKKPDEEYWCKHSPQESEESFRKWYNQYGSKLERAMLGGFDKIAKNGVGKKGFGGHGLQYYGSILSFENKSARFELHPFDENRSLLCFDSDLGTIALVGGIMLERNGQVISYLNDIRTYSDEISDLRQEFVYAARITNYLKGISKKQ